MTDREPAASASASTSTRPPGTHPSSQLGGHVPLLRRPRPLRRGARVRQRVEPAAPLRTTNLLTARVLRGPRPERVERINFGTALLVLRYEDPIRLRARTSRRWTCSRPGAWRSCAAATRTHPNDVNDAAFRLTPDGSKKPPRRQHRPLAFVPRGRTGVDRRRPRPPVARSIRAAAEPRSERLLKQLWYGSGSVASPSTAASKGLDLFVSTVGPGDVEATQVQQIAAYRQHLGDHRQPRAPRIGVGRYVLPVVDPGDRERYERFVDWFVNEFAALGAAPILLGTPAEIVEQIEASSVTNQADILLVYLPYGFTHRGRASCSATSARRLPPARRRCDRRRVAAADGGITRRGMTAARGLHVVVPEYPVPPE